MRVVTITRIYLIRSLYLSLKFKKNITKALKILMGRWVYLSLKYINPITKKTGNLDWKSRYKIRESFEE